MARLREARAAELAGLEEKCSRAHEDLREAAEDAGAASARVAAEKARLEQEDASEVGGTPYMRAEAARLAAELGHGSWEGSLQSTAEFWGASSSSARTMGEDDKAPGMVWE